MYTHTLAQAQTHTYVCDRARVRLGVGIITRGWTNERGLLWRIRARVGELLTFFLYFQIYFLLKSLFKKLFNPWVFIFCHHFFIQIIIHDKIIQKMTAKSLFIRLFMIE
jgi:hypothetical protein